MATKPSATSPHSPIVSTAYKDKLASSGLTLHDAGLLNMEHLSESQTAALGLRSKSNLSPLESLKINYFSPNGKSTGFWRLRYIGKSKGFAGLTKEQKRYVQPPNSSTQAYFPSVTNWMEVLADPAKRIFITEGELKAAAGTLRGFDTIGLGGVWNWRSKKHGIGFLPDLEAINWKQRPVYMVFDSDMKDNPDVTKALLAFTEELTARGAYVFVIALPAQSDGSKNGLDDYLLTHTSGNFNDLILEAEPIGCAKDLWALNNEVVFISNPGLVVKKSTDQAMSPRNFTEANYANRMYKALSINKKGEKNIETKPLAKAWIQWPHRHELEKITYVPGQPVHHDNKWNAWKGWGIKAATTLNKQRLHEWNALIDHIFTGAPAEDKDWFIKWLAYPLQYPGTKLFTSVLLHGIHHGTGKSFIAYIMGKIYGTNFTEIRQEHLDASFNEWAVNKQFVLADDVTGHQDKRDKADKFKSMVSQRTMRVNIKHVPSYEIPDCVNYFFTANQPDVFFLEDKDRRNFIHEVTVGPREETFYNDIDLWYAGDGPSHLFSYLLTIDLSDFNPAAPARQTEAKKRMIHSSKSDIGVWVTTLLETPSQILSPLSTAVDCFTTQQLLSLYDPEGKARLTANGLGRELRRQGFVFCNDGKVVVAGGKADRYYAVRNQDKWREAGYAEIKKHLETAGGKTRGSKK